MDCETRKWQWKWCFLWLPIVFMIWYANQIYTPVGESGNVKTSSHNKEKDTISNSPVELKHQNISTTCQTTSFNFSFKEFALEATNYNYTLPVKAETIGEMRNDYLCMVLSYYNNTYDNINVDSRRYLESIFDNIFPFRIFQIGFNKVGTLSLARFFRRHKLPDGHSYVPVRSFIHKYSGSLIDNIGRSRTSVSLRSNMRKNLENFIKTCIIKKNMSEYDDSGTGSNYSCSDQEFPFRLFSNPWYLDTLMFYADFGMVDTLESLYPFFLFGSKYSDVNQSSSGNYYIVKKNNLNITFEWINWQDSCQEDCNPYLAYSEGRPITWCQILDSQYKDNKSIFLLNMRNVYSFLRSKTAHSKGRLLENQVDLLNKYILKINNNVNTSEYTYPQLTPMDGVKFWYFEWYFVICNTIQYFSIKEKSNSNINRQLLIFDIEYDSIDKMVHFFQDNYKMVLNGSYWTHDHKSQSSTITNNRYPKVIQIISEMVKQHRHLYSNYSETEHATNHVCPKYFWRNKNSNSNSSEWKLFWNQFINLENYANEYLFINKTGNQSYQTSTKKY